MKVKDYIILALIIGLIFIHGYQVSRKKNSASKAAATVKKVVSSSRYQPFVETPVLSPGKSLVKNLQESMRRGADINQIVHGQSLLGRAVQTDNVEAVRLILSSGVDVNAIDTKYGFPPIFFSVKENIAIPYLIRPAPSASAKEFEKYKGYKARQISLIKSNKIFNLLVAHGADTNIPSTSSETLLHAAIRKGRVDLVRKLLTLNADIHAYSQRIAMTPLMYAAYYGNWEILKTLIKAGANVNDESDDGETALSLAEKRLFPKEDQKLYPFIEYDRTISILKEKGAR